MTPTIVTKDGDLRLVVGTPGVATIITSVFQTIMNVVDFGMSAAERQRPKSPQPMATRYGDAGTRHVECANQIGLMRRGIVFMPGRVSNMSLAALRRCLSVPMADAKGQLITHAARMIARPAFDCFILNCLEQHGMFPRQKEFCRR